VVLLTTTWSFAAAYRRFPSGLTVRLYGVNSVEMVAVTVLVVV
jgi:hypothetical protein